MEKMVEQRGHTHDRLTDKGEVRLPGPAVRSTADSPPSAATVRALAAVPAFADLEPSTLVELAAVCGHRCYPKGQVIFHRGDPGDYLYVLVEGRVMVALFSATGGRMVVDTCAPPAVFGEVALLDGGVRTASVETLAPTRVLTVGRADFLALVRDHPALLESLLRVVGLLLRQTLERNSDLMFLDLQGRVAKNLVQLATSRGVVTPAGVTVELGITQAAFSDMVGGSRPMVNQILRGLVNRGLLSLHGRTVTVHDLPGLRHRAGL
ncbi:CRP-like cAMP-binding protein [Actinokineospora baliensis]|uniref:Crp/Fnr family transcriptional regulator n=1 Tax=Actinokineospora baliensis TaxID=547056 RepID=UPI00195990BF|nr:Crp/Fnr family transcriptional regulator [Actinokineospora baliensis]MBM7774726.1 CRP-like cAMP-binding protein [Actinokineospora baliensis]